MSEAMQLAQAKRTAGTFAISQAFVGASAPIAISIGGLSGDYLLGADKTLATLPVTGYSVGVALSALPAALLMRKVGRRYGFTTGALIASLGGALAAAALVVHNFWFFAVALAVIGAGGAFVQQYRFAAADAAPKFYKPQAISWVLGGGMFAAIIGPQAVIWTKDLLAPVSFAGAYLSVIVLGIIGACVLMTLKALPAPASDSEEMTGIARPTRQIITQPRFIVSFLCAATTYALMSFVMTGAPLAMVYCGHSVNEATLGISFHVLAMFAPSFVTGKLIAKFGKETIVATGLLLLIACALVALTGLELWKFWFALVLLGVGWNFGFIGATAMLTDCYQPCEKNQVQGVHDFALFSLVALASLSSGALLNSFGWDVLNWIVLPVAGSCLVMLMVQAVANRAKLKAI
ncbi:MAG: MFS transporter [Ahrensia sp.]|nr:MFS transporter [Ahrensia sp.]